MTSATGNTLTAATGATLRHLMDRTGHSATPATLIYLHAACPVLQGRTIVSDREGTFANAIYPPSTIAH